MQRELKQTSSVLNHLGPGRGGAKANATGLTKCNATTSTEPNRFGFVLFFCQVEVEPVSSGSSN